MTKMKVWIRAVRVIVPHLSYEITKNMKYDLMACIPNYGRGVGANIARAFGYRRRGTILQKYSKSFDNPLFAINMYTSLQSL